MTKFFKYLFSYQIDPLEDYTTILEQIVKWILIVLVVAGTPTAAIGIVEAIQLHQPQSALFYFALFLPIVILLATRKLFSYKVSAFIIVAAIFALGFQNIFIYGFSGAGIPLFLTFFMLITIFYGLKAGLFSILLGMTSVSLIGYLMVTEKISVQVDLMQVTTLPVAWLTATSILVLLGLVMVLSYSFIHFNLLNAIRIAKWHAEKLRKAKDKAEESDRLKSAFLANMSHEIRTPMNGILGFTELLLEPDLSSEEKEAYINVVQQSGQRMLNTVNDIVEISKIEAGVVTVDLMEVDVQVSIDELIRFFMPEATKKGLNLILEKDEQKTCATVITDQNKLDSILTNLIKNAIKYTESGTIKVGCTTVETHYVETQGLASLQFYVNDTGIGIPKNRQQAIFNRFEQADIEDSRAFEGSGLGLTIAKSYVEMLGGKIWVESREEEGSTFFFTLPLSGQAQEKIMEKETRKQDDKSSQIKSLNIIIAEDDKTSALYLETILKKESNRILLTKNGHETVVACLNNPDTDLVLMDIQMAEMNGYDAAREIRKFNKNVIIIAQTAFAFKGDYEKAIKAGCNDYIPKPIKKEVLLEKIQKYF